MYISDVNRKTQELLTHFCERNDLSFEIWENPNEPCIATFFFHDDKRLWTVATKDMLTIYCTNIVNGETKDDWIFIETQDYYQLTW